MSTPANPIPLTFREETIRTALSPFRGRSNPVSAPTLERITGIPEREVRRLIKEGSKFWGREDELFIVCSVPGIGYFIAVDLEEVYATETWLSKLVASAKATQKAFRETCQKQGVSFP